jgi:hypothetical protein
LKIEITPRVASRNSTQHIYNHVPGRLHSYEAVSNRVARPSRQ